MHRSGSTHRGSRRASVTAGSAGRARHAVRISPRRAGVAAGHRQAPARRPSPPFQSRADPPRAAVADIRTAYRRQALVSRNCVPQTPRCRPSCVRLTNTRRSTPLRRPVCLLTSGTACLQKWHPDKLELRGGRGRPSSGEGGSQGAIPAAADGVRRWRVPFDFLYTCVCVNRIRWICIADGESLIRGSAVGRFQEGGVRPRRRRLPVRVRSGEHFHLRYDACFVTPSILDMIHVCAGAQPHRGGDGGRGGRGDQQGLRRPASGARAMDAAVSSLRCGS